MDKTITHKVQWNVLFIYLILFLLFIKLIILTKSQVIDLIKQILGDGTNVEYKSSDKVIQDLITLSGGNPLPDSEMKLKDGDGNENESSSSSIPPPPPEQGDDSNILPP